MTYNELQSNITKAENLIKTTQDRLEDLKAELDNLIPEADQMSHILIIEPLKALYDGLINTWDKQDLYRRNIFKRHYSKMKHDDFVNKYGIQAEQLLNKSPKEIHADNIINGDNMIQSLYDRITSITGSNTDFKGLRYSNNTITGIVAGDSGKARIKSSLVGGYNVQKLHIRFFIKSID